MTNFEKVNPKQSFPKLEENILNFWSENKIFEQSIETRKDSEEFNFYDGPPFATGTPHYGHILAGTLKDVIPRYQTMKGKRVDRVFGWDCHGLPIENIVEKQMEVGGREGIMKMGVHNFNESCRANVAGYTDVWEKSVNRMGRWVDMKNAYKTMDTNFMETVWWVYKDLYDKDLIYQGHRVVPYCPRCTTPLSNFEVNQGYKDKQDKTLTVKFKVTSPQPSPKGEGVKGKFLLAWTTTPWTLMANIGLAVGVDIIYIELKDKKTEETYILAKDRLLEYYKNEDDYIIVREYEGKCLEGIKYEPVFDDFKIQLEDMNEDLGNAIKLGKNAYSVVIGHHVTTESGTGIVHIAPAYGEDDFIIGQKNKLGFVSHIDDSGKTCNTLNDNGKYVFDYNDEVIKTLKERGDIVKISTIDHSYPHCWRCDTPLIYRGISAWYVAVEKIRDKMVKNNQDINWTPEVIKNGRFGKWVEGARDWNISRNRYWGSAIPVWQSEDKSEEVCIGSVKEMYELNKEYGQIERKPHLSSPAGEKTPHLTSPVGEGQEGKTPHLTSPAGEGQEEYKYFYTSNGDEVDIHKHFVDEIKLKHPKTGTQLKRVPEVLDCWFESGAMPYASKHYPFENSENFKFPADFIAEGLDQTRGWFYTLLILGTALFDKAPMKNIIVNGIILAEDGKKMSKSLKNYPDPFLIFDKYGADALRFYLMNSPVVEAQEFRFSESGVEDVVKKVLLPLWNTYYFFTTYANIDNFKIKEGNIFFVRHGQTDNNKNGIVNGGNDNLDLNETGIKQAHELGKQLKASPQKFDMIVSSPMKRAKNTAEILKEYIDYDIEIVIDDAFKEQSYGEFRGQKYSDIEQKYKKQIKKYVAEIYRNNNEENLEQFNSRIKTGFKNLENKYSGKNILLISHGGVFRAINKVINNLSNEDAYYNVGVANNSTLYKLPNYKKSNNLDKWIISELHKLIEEVSNGFDTYKLNNATRPIVKFMDNLTNWYIRRSRKRFWKSENDGDKIEAYNTLNDVLIEVSKVIAPFMPFVSEHIYKQLTNKQSVHLDLFPEVVPGWIFKNLNNDTDKVQKIITLGLAWRANQKIRVRQPLQSITITNNLEKYYIEIIKEELNVKEVLIVDGNSLAKQICKPNGRTIGPKFGKDVKFIMGEAKAGNFDILENGNVKVGNFELESGDFELVFESGDKGALIEAGFGMVIAMDPNISEELKLEGYARDIVRQIQEARKEADYQVDDRIEISITGIDEVLNVFKEYIENETLSSIVKVIEKPDLNKNIEFEDFKVNLILSK